MPLDFFRLGLKRRGASLYSVYKIYAFLPAVGILARLPPDIDTARRKLASA